MATDASLVFICSPVEGPPGSCVEYSWVPTGTRHVIRLQPGQNIEARTDHHADVSHVQVYSLRNGHYGQAQTSNGWQFPAGPAPTARKLTGAVISVSGAYAYGVGVYDDGSASPVDTLSLQHVGPFACGDPGSGKAEDPARPASSVRDWKWDAVRPKFGEQGCSIPNCPYHQDPRCADILCCALNLSDALIRAGYTLPAAPNVNYCAHQRVRNADGMARICNVQNGGSPDVQTWANRPSWKGIVYFEGNLAVDFASHVRATGHIDLWDGQHAVHAEYPSADVVWFWRLG